MTSVMKGYASSNCRRRSSGSELYSRGGACCCCCCCCTPSAAAPTKKHCPTSLVISARCFNGSVFASTCCSSAVCRARHSTGMRSKGEGTCRRKGSANAPYSASTDASAPLALPRSCDASAYRNRCAAAPDGAGAAPAAAAHAATRRATASLPTVASPYRHSSAAATSQPTIATCPPASAATARSCHPRNLSSTDVPSARPCVTTRRIVTAASCRRASAATTASGGAEDCEAESSKKTSASSATTLPSLATSHWSAPGAPLRVASNAARTSAALLHIAARGKGRGGGKRDAKKLMNLSCFQLPPPPQSRLSPAHAGDTPKPTSPSPFHPHTPTPLHPHPPIRIIKLFFQQKNANKNEIEKRKKRGKKKINSHECKCEDQQ
eukprot:Rhum_TRINITY_DN14533_c1_g1::Rhum_TRINITY_DN14533_c1_g1_i1::g.99008::m.99008